MPRMPRLFAPDMPLHVVQRGHDRQPIFAATADLCFFRHCLLHAARANAVAIHAYALMTNHVHLLGTPRFAISMPRMIQAVGRVYVKYFNTKYRRSGTLWEGRYRAAIVDSDRYLLTCMCYIELNPVRAGMVRSPGEYPWSSFQANALGAIDALVQPHMLYRALGGGAEARQAAYRALFRTAIPEPELRAIRDATRHGSAVGNAAFRRKVGALGRRAERLPMGRPSSDGPVPRDSGV